MTAFLRTSREVTAVCGISGWVAYGHDLAAERRTVGAMTATMACRGPDAEGLWLGRHAALGHRRLAIIDLPGGSQPMGTIPSGAEAEVVLVYSGEVYNFTDLRDELRQRGHVFDTDSDTEVVLHGYLEWGGAVAERLNGMYAFAVWDGRDESLHLIRDRMGIKPLYWYATDDGVLFGSEPKAILAHPRVQATVGTEGLQELFGFVKTPGAAIWDGMREVLPGTVLRVDRSGRREHTYWSLHAIEHTDDQADTVEHVRVLLDDIVARQLVSDVPLCVLLSGGLDSSALTALAARQLAERDDTVRSFAVDFVGQEENFVPDAMRATPDAPYVHEVAEHVGSVHRDIVLDPATLADPAVRRAAVTARDLPVGFGDIDQSLYLLFASIRGQSTVALSGESADEVFGGYAWFHDPAVQQAPTFPWIAMSMQRGGGSPRRESGASPSSPFHPDLMRRLDLQTYVRDRYHEALLEVPRLDGESEHEQTMRRISYLHLTRFVRLLLDRKDRMSMASGLEVRVPFCDHRLVEYVFNAPWSLKTFDGREKSLLRHATADLLPRSVVDRVKSPYPSTQDAGYTTQILDQAKAVMSSESGALALFDSTWLQRLATIEHPDDVGQGTRWVIERLLDLAVWFELYRPVLH